MPLSLSPLIIGQEIVDKAGGVTLTFLQRWQELITGFQKTPTRATLSKTAQNAALLPTTIYTTANSGTFRVGYYLRKTAIDGVSSSTQVTISWIEHGVALTKTFTANAVDALTAVDSNVWQITADANSAIGIAVAYASGTPGLMHYALTATVEELA